MSTLTNDTAVAQGGGSRAASGLVMALASAVSFGMAGALARPLLDAGWSPGSVVLVRIGLGALIVVPFGIRSLGGDWSPVRRNVRLIVMYGVLAVAGAQFCYFSAVAYMQVAPALLIEYTAPVAVVVWLWLRHAQRPGLVTVAGGAVCALGLVLVLDLFSGAGLSAAGVLWALAAMVGLAAYFVLGADDSTGLPPLALAAGGLVVGAVVLGAFGVTGLMPMQATTELVTYAGVEVSWWVPLVLLGLVSAAISYVTGIAAARQLGSRLASFVALSEVVAAVLWAWLLLGELPNAMQLGGGALVLVGVVGVMLGEPAVVRPEPVPV